MVYCLCLHSLLSAEAVDKEKQWIKFYELTVSTKFAKNWEEFGVTELSCYDNVTSMSVIHNDVNGCYSRGTCVKFVWVAIGKKCFDRLYLSEERKNKILTCMQVQIQGIATNAYKQILDGLLYCSIIYLISMSASYNSTSSFFAEL